MGQVEARRLAEQRRDLLRERRRQIAQVAASLEPPHELGGGADADVGREQRLLEPLPRLGVVGVECRDRELVGQRSTAARQRVAKAAEESRALDLGLVRPLGVAEQLSPAPCHGGQR